jgi:phosphohistidine phosphatase
MELYFVRHAIAADQAPDGSGDFGRPLTKEGAEKMRWAAKGLHSLGVETDLLLSSPLVRARETAAILGDVYKQKVTIAEQLSPGCDLPRLWDLLEQQGLPQRVMLVGHEPDFSVMIGGLTGGRVDIKKGSACLVRTQSIDEGAGMLIWLLPPKVLRALG